MAGLEFRIDLSGNLTSALGQAGKGLHGAGEGAKHAKHEFELFEAETGKLSGELGGLGFNLQALSKGGSLFTFDLAEALHGAVELVSTLVEKFVDLGKEMIGVAGKTQDLNLALELNVGAEKAKEIDELAESFERTTRFNGNDIKRALLPLLKEGVTDTDTLDNIATIATDMAARNAGGIEDVQQTIASFAGIFQRGRLKPQALAQFGIQANDYFAQLGHTLGVSGEAAAKMAKQGKISQDKLVDAAMNMVAARQGGAIGDPSLRAEKTLGATLTRLGNLKDKLFEGIADSPGMHAVQGFLDNFIATMQGPIGQDLVAKLSDAFTTLFGDLSGPDGLQKMQDAVAGIASKVGGFMTDFKNAWPDVKAGAQGVWDIIKEIAREVGKVVEGWREIHGFFKDVDSGRINKDIADTIMGDNGGIAGDTVNANSPAWKRAKAAGGQLPSQGGMAPIFDVPQFATGGVVTGPTLALIGEGGPEAVVPLNDPSMSTTLPAMGSGQGRGGSMSITIGEISIPMQVAGGGTEAGLQAAQSVRVELKKVLDELGWAYGATILE